MVRKTCPRNKRRKSLDGFCWVERNGTKFMSTNLTSSGDNLCTFFETMKSKESTNINHFIPTRQNGAKKNSTPKQNNLVLSLIEFFVVCMIGLQFSESSELISDILCSFEFGHLLRMEKDSSSYASRDSSESYNSLSNQNKDMPRGGYHLTEFFHSNTNMF